MLKIGGSNYYTQLHLKNEEGISFTNFEYKVILENNIEIIGETDDFNSLKVLFIHEMAHVWQHYLGYSVILNGCSIATKGGYIDNKAYEYLNYLPNRNDISQFNMEQQASIISDFFYANKANDKKYQQILKRFFQNPKDKSLLPTTTDF